MKNKRDATAEETEQALIRCSAEWNRRNSNSQIEESEWWDKQQIAESEGYKSEVCGDCNVVFLAFHHFIACHRDQCPMKGSVSVLSTFLGEETENQ